MQTETTRNLDQDALYVVYCDGIGCNASTRGALKLARLGFKVKELIGGIEWWKVDGYTTEGMTLSESNPSDQGVIGKLFESSKKKLVRHHHHQVIYYTNAARISKTIAVA